jgi:hypothetical protein
VISNTKIQIVVGKFQKLDNEGRFKLLSILFKEPATSAQELTFRAELCTALEQAEVYPQEEPGADISFSD